MGHHVTVRGGRRQGVIAAVAAVLLLGNMLVDYQSRVEVAVRAGSPNPAQVLPPLLHLSSNRLNGIDPVTELRAYTFWERALESLGRHRP